MAIESVDQLFENALPEKLREIEIPPDWDFKVQFEIQENDNWYLFIQEGDYKIFKGVYENPGLTVKVNEQNFLKLVNREMSPHMAVFTRKVKLEGDLGILTKVQSLKVF